MHVSALKRNYRGMWDVGMCGQKGGRCTMCVNEAGHAYVCVCVCGSGPHFGICVVAVAFTR